MSCSYGISSGKSYKAAAEVLCSEGFHKGVPSTILQLPKGISSTTLLQNHTVSQENVSVDPTVLPCESERDESGIQELQFHCCGSWMATPTQVRPYSHRKPETQAFNRLAIRMNYVPIRNRKYRFLICWQKKASHK